MLRDDIMQRKLGTANQLLLLQIVQLVHVVGVEDLDEELLVLLEGEGHVDRGNELWVQVVEDHLGLAALLLLVPLELPEDAEGIGLGSLVKVWQVHAREREHQALRQAVVEV